ncbi:DUF3269 family protein [Staphylococcus epidermidis]|uniref:DUF3269 family protein n=1 Tax=Staphylococcus epidermidis TaxID=1282 RepID=UPI0011A379B9|nr:DUF3269 family protein [Staphylococcus epidermidis]
MPILENYYLYTPHPTQEIKVHKPHPNLNTLKTLTPPHFTQQYHTQLKPFKPLYHLLYQEQLPLQPTIFHFYHSQPH